MLRATATALFEGSQDPKAPITKGRVNPRQLYFSIFLARFSTIFGYFGWKHELYPISHEDHENRVLFCVSSMVT
jgi:hypothetical protein